MKKFSLIALLLLLTTAAMHADEPFRQHRANHFATLVPEKDGIVFIGNSITNMFEWREGFGSASVLNRGISGAYSYEVLDNLESYIVGRPKKVFIMIGTNDLGTNGINFPEYPTERVRKILKRIRNELPEAEVYMQSILPSTSGLRTADNVKRTNQLYQSLCEEYGVEYIDLYSKLVQSGSDNMPSTHTYDNLHLTAMGYSVWCKAIEDKVGFPSQFPSNTQNKNNGLSGFYGMRLTYFAQLPVEAEDILMFGDELQHGGELAELLGNPHVKSRGAGWGYPGPDIATLQKYVGGMLNGRTTNAQPAKIFIYAGTADLNAGTDVKTAAASYAALVKDIRTKAPQTQIYIEALLPNSNASTTTSKYIPFNDSLQDIATRLGATYIDTYTPLADAGKGKSELFQGNYLNGLGYAALAEVLAPYVGDCHPLTVEQARRNLALNNARNAVGAMLSMIDDVNFGSGVGCYPETARATLAQAEAAAYAVLAKGAEATVEELNAQAQALQTALNAVLPAIVLPEASTAEAEHWYTLCSTLRGNYYLHSSGAGAGLVGGSGNNHASMMWKFQSRGDGTYDIINRGDGSYISPTATYNTQVKTSASRPASGWTLLGSSKVGMFIISSGTVQLNQTNLTGLPIYNWSSGRDGNDTKDAGCQFTIREVETDPVDEVSYDTPDLVTSLADLTTGWYRIMCYSNAPFSSYYGQDELLGRYVYNGAEEYRQNATNSYPLFVQGEAQAPSASDASYYIRIVQGTGTNLYVQSANGHYLKANSTASRDAAEATAFSYDAAAKAFGIGNYWVYFPSLSNIMGKSSSAAFAANRYKVYAVSLADADLDAWHVNIEGASAAAEVRDDVQLQCNSSAASGITRVYSGGYLFLKRGVTPTTSDFTTATISGLQATITIDATHRSIDVHYGLPNAIAPTAQTATTLPHYDLLGRQQKKNTRGITVSKKGVEIR